jgi:hypothetical protein
MGSPPPVQGYNHNVRYRNRIYHVQTEDSGVENPHVYTHLFQGGVIISSAKTDYQEHIETVDLKNKVRKLMQGQHKLLMKKLRRGELDEKIVTLLGTLEPDESALAAQEKGAAQDTDAERVDEKVEDRPPTIAVKTETEAVEAGGVPAEEVAEEVALGIGAEPDEKPDGKPAVVIEKDGDALRKVSEASLAAQGQPLSREVATELEALADEPGGVSTASAGASHAPDTDKVKVDVPHSPEATEPEVEGLSAAEIAELDTGLPELPLTADTVRIPADAAAAAVAAFQALDASRQAKQEGDADVLPDESPDESPHDSGDVSVDASSLLQAIDAVEGITEFEVEGTEAGLGMLNEGELADAAQGSARMANPTEQMEIPIELMEPEEEFDPLSQQTGPQRPSTLYSVVRSGSVEEPLARRAVRPSRRVKAADLIPPAHEDPPKATPAPVEAKADASDKERAAPVEPIAAKEESQPQRELPPVARPEPPVLPKRRKTKIPPHASTLYRYVAPTTGTRTRKDTGAYSAAAATVSPKDLLKPERTGRLASKRGRRRISGEYSVLGQKKPAPAAGAGGDTNRPNTGPEEQQPVEVVARNAVMVDGPQASREPQTDLQTGQQAPPDSKTPSIPDMFGSDLISERSLDEVILGYLSEDAENPEKK